MKKTIKPARNQRLSSPKQRKQQHLLDVKVRSRAATRNRNNKVLTLICTALLFCGSVGGILYGGREALRKYFWQNPDYFLREVEIHTDGPLTREQVLAATNIQEGKNIFTISLSAARKGLMALPQVDRAEIERVSSNKISIDIVERKPVAWAAEKEGGDPSSDPGAFLIDHNGILLRVKNQVPEYYHLPVICGIAVNNYEEGETVDLPEVRSALELIQLTGENPARYQVRSIDVSKGYCMVVTDERHAKITFPLEDIKGQLDRLALLFANVDEAKKEIQTVNLLVQRNVPVTFAPDADANAADGADAADPTHLSDQAAKPLMPAKAQSASAPQSSPAKTLSGDDSKKAQFLSSTHKTAPKHAEVYHKSSAAAAHHVYHEPEETVRRAIPVSPIGAQP